MDRARRDPAGRRTARPSCASTNISSPIPAWSLGSHARATSAYGPTYTCLPTHADETALSGRLIEALYTVPPALYTPRAPIARAPDTLFDETIEVGTAADGATIKEGSYLVINNALAQIINGRPSKSRSARARERKAFRPNTPGSFAA